MGYDKRFTSKFYRNMRDSVYLQEKFGSYGTIIKDQWNVTCNWVVLKMLYSGAF